MLTLGRDHKNGDRVEEETSGRQEREVVWLRGCCSNEGMGEAMEVGRNGRIQGT